MKCNYYRMFALSALHLCVCLCQLPGEDCLASTRRDVTTLLQPNQSPVVSFRILWKTGAAEDPKGKDGLAALTAAMLSKGGSRSLAYDQILAAMFPLATTLDWQADKEMIVFVGATHLDNLEKYYQLIRQMLLEPGFREDDFNRLKSDAVNELKVVLRESNDEELGKEELYNLIYAGHPYGHHNLGSLSGLEAITLEDVKLFYQKFFASDRITIGLAGGYPQALPARVQADFGKLPKSKVMAPRIKPPKKLNHMKVEIVQRDTRSIAISLGFPIQVRRGNPDWPALAVAASYLGQHRSSVGMLYQRLREDRGLNYGDYAYLEYFPRGMYLLQPEPNLGRQQQIFQLWIRPVDPGSGLFALRAALYEYDRLVRDGISAEAFNATREFLTKYVNVLTQTQDARLGYALDSRYYGTEEFGAYLKNALQRLTPEKVNRSMRRYWGSRKFQVVMVAKDSEGLRTQILNREPSSINYNSPKPEQLLKEDQLISTYPLPVRKADVIIKRASEVFK
jgi:zinc protease